jgi:CRP-like cAMP-binding protein
MEELIQMRQMIEKFIQLKMPEEVFKRLESIFKIKKISKGEIVIHVGDTPNELYFVLSGVLRSYYIDIKGNDVTHFFPRRTSICCGEALFIEVPSKHCIEALEDCEALAANVNDAKNLIEEEIYFMKVHLKTLEWSFKYKIERESSFLMKSATERYLDFKSMYPELDGRVYQAYIASYLGITPVSLSRIKRAIREQN